MSYKNFTKIILVIIFTTFLFNLFLWIFFTGQILKNERDFGHGDLARLGYIKILPALTEQRSTIEKHIELEEYINEKEKGKVDILTIGDSFFNKGGGYYFQDGIVSEYNKTVLNIKCIPGYEALEMLLVLINTGLLDEISPKMVVIESVGRYCIDRYGKEINIYNDKYKISKDDFLKNYTINKNKKNNVSSFFDPRMYQFNAKYIISNIKAYKFPTKESKVGILDLDYPLFTNPKNEKKLLFYNEDIINIAAVNYDSVKTMNNNFNNVAEILDIKNIKFVFMPAVDKYDLYYPHVASNNKIDNPLFTYLRLLDKKYIFIDTKEILQKSLNKGEKDIYWNDDTHWSWKGGSLVWKELVNHVE